MSQSSPQSPFETPADAERGFYEAFANLDLDRMMTVWSAAEDIVCTHPGAQPLMGPSAVAMGWKRIFGNATRGVDMNIRVTRRWETDTLACHVVTESIKGKDSSGSVSATNIYRFENGGWHMVLHHGGPLPDGTVIKGQVTRRAPRKTPTVH